MPVSVSSEGVETFDQKLNAFRTEIKAAVDAREKKEVTLVVTEKEVNSKLVQVLAEGELPLERILINFSDGRFLVYTIVETSGVNAKTGAIGRIEVVKGAPKIIIEDFNLGKLPLPKIVNMRVEQLANIVVRLQLADMSLEITSVQIKNRQLTVIGTTKTGT